MKAFFYIFLAVIGGFFIHNTLYNTSQAQTKKSANIVVQNNVSGLVVAELFTSQSCSSCPPADKVLKELSKDKDVIALSCHVTYWNHLHWKDTLSQEFCTQRQRSYAHAFKNRNVYTPQLVVNGRYEFTGSRKKQADQTVQMAKTNNLLSIDIKKEGSHLTISLPTIPDHANKNFQLVLMSYADGHTQKIPSGENRGRTVHYTNPVTGMVSLGHWNGKKKSFKYDLNEESANAGYVVLAQEKAQDRGPGKAMPIFAAGRLEL